MKKNHKNKEYLKNEDDLRIKDNLNNEGDQKKGRQTQKLALLLPPNLFCSPPLPLKNNLKICLMTSHLDRQTTTDVKPDMIPGFQTRNGIPHDKYIIRNIAHAHTNRKDDPFMQRRLIIDEAHMALDIDIFRFAVFLNSQLLCCFKKMATRWQ